MKRFLQTQFFWSHTLRKHSTTHAKTIAAEVCYILQLFHTHFIYYIYHNLYFYKELKNYPVFIQLFNKFTYNFIWTFIHLCNDYIVLTLYECYCSFVLPFQSFAFMDVIIHVLYNLIAYLMDNFWTANVLFWKKCFIGGLGVSIIWMGKITFYIHTLWKYYWKISSYFMTD